MSLRAVRCEACRQDELRYCPHNHVLLVFIDAAPVAIISQTEESARLTADRLRMKFKGKPFHRRVDATAGVPST